MEEALHAGVERIIYTSSVALRLPSPATSPADESCWLDENQAIGAYKKSKVVAERLVENMVRHAGLRR